MPVRSGIVNWLPLDTCSSMIASTGNVGYFALFGAGGDVDGDLVARADRSVGGGLGADHVVGRNRRVGLLQCARLEATVLQRGDGIGRHLAAHVGHLDIAGAAAESV